MQSIKDFATNAASKALSFLSDSGSPSFSFRPQNMRHRRDDLRPYVASQPAVPFVAAQPRDMPKPAPASKNDVTVYPSTAGSALAAFRSEKEPPSASGTFGIRVAFTGSSAVSVRGASLLGGTPAFGATNAAPSFGAPGNPTQPTARVQPSQQEAEDGRQRSVLQQQKTLKYDSLPFLLLSCSF
jgi:hypothetical protein